MKLGMSCLLCLPMIRPSIPPFVSPLFVSTTVLASLPRSLPPSLLSQLLSPSLSPCLPSTSLHPSVATSLPSSLPLPLPFSRLCLFPFLCLLFSVPTLLSTRCYLSSLNKLSNDISIAVCSSLWWDFGFSFGWTIISTFFQRHDAKNGETDNDWKRMRSCLSRCE